jgi:hypothetical protein
MNQRKNQRAKENQMAKNKDSSKVFQKGGYKNRKRPSGVSRSGLPKTYPSHINMTLRAEKVKI